MIQHFFVKLIVGIVFASIFVSITPGGDSPQQASGFDGSNQVGDFGPVPFLISAILIAPIIETLLLQMLPIELFRRFNRSVLFQFGAGMIPFASLHFFAGIEAGIAAGVVGGVFFSYTYLECRKASLFKAAGVTCITHFIHNLVFAPLLVISLI